MRVVRRTLWVLNQILTHNLERKLAPYAPARKPGSSSETYWVSNRGTSYAAPRSSSRNKVFPARLLLSNKDASAVAPFPTNRKILSSCGLGAAMAAPDWNLGGTAAFPQIVLTGSTAALAAGDLWNSVAIGAA